MEIIFSGAADKAQGVNLIITLRCLDKGEKQQDRVKYKNNKTRITISVHYRVR